MSLHDKDAQVSESAFSSAREFASERGVPANGAPHSIDDSHRFAYVLVEDEIDDVRCRGQTMSMAANHAISLISRLGSALSLAYSAFAEEAEHLRELVVARLNLRRIAHAS